MPFDQNGNYRRLYGPTGWQDDRDAGTKILSARHDEDGNDTAAALNECFLSDGRKTASGHFKMGGYRVGGLGDAQSAQDAATAKQIQTNAFNYAEDVSKEANLIKVNLTPAPQALPKSMFLAVKIKNANTGKTTLQLGALEAKPVCLGAQEIAEGMLSAGEVYVFFYNAQLGAFQLLPSGAAVGPVVPPWTMIVLDHLLTGPAAVGWELQGTRCYKSKYWDQYQQLVIEYASAVARTETVEGTEFSYKLNTDTMRRFYTKNDYDARFALCGDTGGYVLDEETYSFYLPKSKNYFRPSADTAVVGAYEPDTMRPITGKSGAYFYGQYSLTEEGALHNTDNASRYGNDGSGTWGGVNVNLDSARLGEHYAGAETKPKGRLVAVYYKMGTAYTEQISTAALFAEQQAQLAQDSVAGIDARVERAENAVTQAERAAQEAQTAAQGLTPDGTTITKSAAGVLSAVALQTNVGPVTQVYLTQAEYDALSAEDQVKAGVEYNIFADEVAA